MQSELYKYNCHTKKEKLLTIVPVDAECEFYTINSIATDKINKKYRNILMRRYQCSADV